MENTAILIVDDEKNIRLTLSQALESLNLPIQTAVNGEEALQKLAGNEYSLMLLDLKMPGMSGMQLLRKVREKWPKIRVIIITAHGTIESAVEALKLGAVDFIQKPFTPMEIRELATKVLEREKLDSGNVADYQSLIELAKRNITDGWYDDAAKMTQKAISADSGQPEAYNLLGALMEIKGDIPNALKYYRTAINIDATYKPAWANLDRATSSHKFGKINLGIETPAKADAEKTGHGDKDDEK
jgi:DNA-binding response OmpR family regulator